MFGYINVNGAQLSEENKKIKSSVEKKDRHF